MRESGSLQVHVDRAADAVASEVARLYEGLEQLAAVTIMLFQEVRPTDAELDRFRDDELTTDPDGYFARAAVLEAAMKGDIDPAQTVFYVHERFAENRDVLLAMYRLRNFGPLLQRLHERIGGLEWIYYQHPLGWAMSYPMHDPHGAIPADFDWLSYFTFESVEPSVNPEREIRWTPPNIDYAGKGLMISPSIPVYLDDGTFAGVWSMDVPIAHLLEGVKMNLEMSNQDTFIVDSEGLLVAHRRIATVIEEKGSFSRESIRALGGSFRDLDASELLEQPFGTRELVAEDGTALACAHRRLEGLGWGVVMTCPAADLFETVRGSFEQAFARLSGGDLAYRIEHLGGEGQLLVDAYNDMAEALQRTIEEREREQNAMQKVQRLQAIGQLAGGIAHDFNNLLTVMLASAAMIKVEGRDEALVTDIRIAAERAAAMTAQLLAFSRDSVAQPQLLDLSSVILELESLLRRLLPDGIDLMIETRAKDAMVMADPHQILQLLLNLVINARDALGTRGTIRIEVAAHDEHVTLCVLDDGSGIPAELVARVFEPFFTTKETGAGLGLSTVKQIADSLDGTVALESAPDTGTRVRVQLPAAGGTPARTTETAEPVLDGLRVLLVDDDALVLQTTIRVLERLGCVVSGHTVARDAIATLQSGTWDVLLTDVVMPGIGGREVSKIARETAPGIRVLFMSGYTPDALLMHGIREAEERLLRKPFTPSQLAEALAETVASKA